MTVQRKPVRDTLIAELKWSDGAVMQSHLVAVTDASKATVSRRLSELEEEGRIVRLRTGGQNRVWLREYAPSHLSLPDPAEPRMEGVDGSQALPDGGGP